MISISKILLLYLELCEEDENFISVMLCERNEMRKMFAKRKTEGSYNILIQKHLFDDEEKFREYFRVSTSLFHFILNAVKDDITTFPCYRVTSPISAEEKLCRTLRFLATGQSYRSLAFDYRISPSYICILVPAVLKVICQRLLKRATPEPTERALIKSEEGFSRTWNYPNCVGAIDGKHIRIVCPKKSASLYFNYKEYFSIVLFALVDSNYKFLGIDVGSYGKEGDAGIYHKSQLGQSIDGGKFPFPKKKKLPNTNILLPHVILDDEAFSLTTNVMKPFRRQSSKAHEELQKAIYNYRHCRARRIVENTFGILCQYFRIFFTPIAGNPESANLTVIAACIIHYFLRDERIPSYSHEERDLNERDPRIPLPVDNMVSLAATGGNSSHHAFQIRDEFKKYFCSQEGELPWQVAHILRTS